MSSFVFIDGKIEELNDKNNNNDLKNISEKSNITKTSNNDLTLF